MLVDKNKIIQLVYSPELLYAYLKSLTNSRFRLVSQFLSEGLLDNIENKDFWNLFAYLFVTDRKAFLGTLLKALSLRIEKIKSTNSTNGFLSSVIDENILNKISLEMTELDRKKILLSIIPHLSHPSEIEYIFKVLNIDEASLWIPYLLQVQTQASCYLLLKSLRYVESDREILIKTCHFLMKKGDTHSFNLASIIRLSYALDEVHGTFSLVLQPYQLSSIEQNFDVFCKYY